MVDCGGGGVYPRGLQVGCDPNDWLAPSDTTLVLGACYRLQQVELVEGGSDDDGGNGVCRW